MKEIDFPQDQCLTIGQLATFIPAEEVQSWPEHSKTAAIDMIYKFGLPDVISTQVLIWKRDSNPLIIEKYHGLMGQTCAAP